MNMSGNFIENELSMALLLACEQANREMIVALIKEDADLAYGNYLPLKALCKHNATQKMHQQLLLFCRRPLTAIVLIAAIRIGDVFLRTSIIKKCPSCFPDTHFSCALLTTES